MKPVVLAAICGAALIAAATAQAGPPRKARVGVVVLELYYNAQTASIVRSNNVAQVANPTTGTYCITPNKPVDPNIIYPVATAEYVTGGLAPYGGAAEWQDTSVASDCPAGDLEVKTTYQGTPQQAVSFSLIVFN